MRRLQRGTRSTAPNCRDVDETVKNLKIAQARCRQDIREAKRTSFRKYISKINNKTPMNKIRKKKKNLNLKELSETQ